MAQSSTNPPRPTNETVTGTVSESAPAVLASSSAGTSGSSTVQFPDARPPKISTENATTDKRRVDPAVRLSVLSQASGVSSDSSLTSTSLKTEYKGPIIPPYHDRNFRHRTIVLCFDGTGDQFDMDNSNVIQLFSVLKKGDRKRQLVYYQSGIGTYTVPHVATPLASKVRKTIDLMFATGLDHHVMSGYQYLMENYKEGDKICMFGFSRGAYTVRALAGMIHKVGLLPSGNHQQVPFAYKMYTNDTERGWAQSVCFKRTFSMDVDIAFVGVWDTVASVGLLPKTLPFTKSNTAIKVFRHALALDEHRTKFKPSTYEKITEAEAKRGDYVPPAKDSETASIVYSEDNVEALNEACADFIANNTDPKALMLLTHTYTAGTFLGSVFLFYDGATPPAGTFDKILSIPALTGSATTQKYTAFIKNNGNGDLGIGPFGWAAHSIPLTTYPLELIETIARTVKSYGERIQSEHDYPIAVTFAAEPFSSPYTHSKGGAYPHSADRQVTPSAPFIGYATSVDVDVNTELALRNTFVSELKNFVGDIQAKAIELGVSKSSDIVYPNYALGDTDLSLLYGGNVQQLKQIAQKYDPKKVMTLTGGFKFQN